MVALRYMMLHTKIPAMECRANSDLSPCSSLYFRNNPSLFQDALLHEKWIQAWVWATRQGGVKSPRYLLLICYNTKSIWMSSLSVTFYCSVPFGRSYWEVCVRTPNGLLPHKNHVHRKYLGIFLYMTLTETTFAVRIVIVLEFLKTWQVSRCFKLKIIFRVESLALNASLNHGNTTTEQHQYTVGMKTTFIIYIQSRHLYPKQCTSGRFEHSTSGSAVKCSSIELLTPSYKLAWPDHTCIASHNNLSTMGSSVSKSVRRTWRQDSY